MDDIILLIRTLFMPVVTNMFGNHGATRTAVSLAAEAVPIESPAVNENQAMLGNLDRPLTQGEITRVLSNASRLLD